MDSSAARLLRGFLEPCLLSLLAEHADYGLSLAQRLAAAGLDEVPGGTLQVRMFPTEEGEHVGLAGAAELVFDGELDLT